ncbi:helix-turn-helix domain-containing protein, partial [Cerasicoccus arenae]
PFTPKKLDSAPAISSPPHTATAPPPLESLAPIAPAATLESACDALYQILRKETDEGILSEIEREMIIRALKEFDGNQVKTAKLLGITRATLRKRIEQMDLKV